MSSNVPEPLRGPFRLLAGLKAPFWYSGERAEVNELSEVKVAGGIEPLHRPLLALFCTTTLPFNRSWAKQGKGEVWSKFHCLLFGVICYLWQIALISRLGGWCLHFFAPRNYGNWHEVVVFTPCVTSSRARFLKNACARRARNSREMTYRFSMHLRSCLLHLKYYILLHAFL